MSITELTERETCRTGDVERCAYGGGRKYPTRHLDATTNVYKRENMQYDSTKHPMHLQGRGSVKN